MLSAAAQLSIRSALDNMLTWTTFKLNKPATGEKMSKKKKDIFSVVMTPDRIPKFFIPSLDVEHVFVEGEMAGDTADSIPERPITLEKALSRTGRRSHSESHLRKDILGERETLRKKTSLCHMGHRVLSDELEKAVDHSDPTTRAALSLPHLPKITTPYGFLTLGESPNIRRKESLFFDHDAMDLRTLLSQRKKRSSPLSRSPSSPLKDGQHRSGGPETTSPLRTGRSASCEAIGRIPPLSPLSHSALERCPAKSDKKRFQALMRKHLSGIKSLRSRSGPVEKLPAPVGRTQSNPFA